MSEPSEGWTDGWPELSDDEKRQRLDEMHAELFKFDKPLSSEKREAFQNDAVRALLQAWQSAEARVVALSEALTARDAAIRENESEIKRHHDLIGWLRESLDYALDLLSDGVPPGEPDIIALDAIQRRLNREVGAAVGLVPSPTHPEEPE